MDTLLLLLYKMEAAMRRQNRYLLQAFIKPFRSDIGLLVTVWVFGLVLGALLAPGGEDPFLSLMRPELTHRVSIVFGLMSASLPLLLAAYAVSIYNAKLLYLISFSKAFLFSYCGFFVYSLFGSAGWLMRLLLQFTDIVSVPVYCWFCIRQVAGKKRLAMKDLIISLLVTLSAAGIDYVLLGPFFAMLIDI